jgi:hypothetical protein
MKIIHNINQMFTQMNCKQLSNIIQPNDNEMEINDMSKINQTINNLPDDQLKSAVHFLDIMQYFK